MKLICRFATARAQAQRWCAVVSSQKRFSPFRSFAFLLFLALGGISSPAAAPDVTSQVETLGNPFLERYGSSAASSRVVNRMRLFGNRIYLGHGNTGSTGPTDVWSFDTEQDAFIKDGVLFDELIDQMRTFGDRLYVNGRDSMGQGAMFRLESGKGWQTYKIADDDGHYYDIYEFGGKIFSNVGVNTRPWPRVGISVNDGASFDLPVQAASPFASAATSTGWEFMEMNGNLYLGYNRSTSTDTNNHPPFISKYTGNDAAPLDRVHWLYADFYGDGTIALPSNFLEVSPGLGIFTGLGYLYSTPNIEVAGSANRLLGQPAGLDPVTLGVTPAANSAAGTGIQAIRKYDGMLYLVHNFRLAGDPTYWIAVCESSDGLTWTEKFRFTTGARARSFERAPNGDFYFGSWGVLTAQGEAAIPGYIYRVRAGAIAVAPPAIVSVSADALSVFKGSGNDLAFRFRRSGPTNAPLTINYSVSGDAIAGTDYTAPSGAEIIPAGAYFKDATIVNLNNPATVGARTVVVNISASASYAIATPASLALTLTDETAGSTTLPKVGLAFWLKADQGVTSDGSGFVSVWADQSGHGYSALQATGGQQPKLIASGQNGRPTIDFDGVNDWLNVGPINAQAYYTAIVFSNRTVITASAPAASQTLVNFMSYAQGGSAGLDLGPSQDTMSGEILGTYMQAWVGSVDENSISSAPHILSWRQAKHAEQFSLKLTGLTAPIVTAPEPARIITPNCEALKLGSREGSSRFFNGAISEVIIYNRPLTVAEAAIVEAYLNQRYLVPNQDPIAVGDAISRAPGEDPTVPGAALKANDTDADNDTLTVTGVGSPTPLGASVSFDGSTVIYTAPANNNANGSFTYTISDGRGGSAIGIVTVEVTNEPVVASDDTFERQPGDDLVLTFNDVTANDDDPDNDPLLVTSVPATLPSGATVAIEGMTVRYHPPSGFNGTDQFNYTVSDGRGFTDTAEVTVTVANHAPTPGADFRTTSVGQALAMTVASLLANDADSDGDAIASSSVEARSASLGTVRYSSATGNLVYIPPSGFNGTDSFHYTIVDARGLTALVTVEVAVVISNQAPTPLGDLYNRAVDKPITILYAQLLLNDTDPDNDVPLRVVAAMGRTPAGAKVVMGAASLTYTAPPGYNGADTFSYTVRDNRGAMATATVSIKVGVASPRISPLLAGEVQMSATRIPAGKVALRAIALPGAVLQIDSAADASGDWSSLHQIRTGQDGIAYFEEEQTGSRRFFKATAITQ